METVAMAVLSRVISFLVSIIFAVSGVISPALSQQVRPKDEDALQLSFATLSDSHLTDAGVARQTMLSQGFRDLDGKVDAIVVVGDMTNHGERTQYQKFYDCVNKSIKASKFIPVAGNHDTRTENLREEDPTYEFIRAYNEYSGKNLTKPYFTEEVKGYTFIVLFTENLSDEQISWFDSEMEKAAKKDKPIFVMCHWPINGVCGQMEIDPGMGMGAQSDKVQAILEKYKNVFYFCGHVHAGLRGEVSNKLFGNQSVETIKGVHYINLPSYMYLNTDGWASNNGGNLLSGCGYIAEVYKNEVVLRARNYALGFYMSVYEKTIKLVK